MSRALVRPSWWPRWVPARCGACRQPWLPGRVTLSWAPCECPGAGEAHGHHIWYCAATPGCHWHVWPEEHVQGAEVSDRPG